ncbi:hypothetical protein JMN32_19830 [Fulvivirga sp. 29W222]|uniref:Uncharacterized protein n=1 Tax=Fulvivirga marina TaxID=2494733 RepID=A0A937G525_9BACT|nr:hypothetical protein [Fulvivirga marina]MBL6448571.1 hypothetical protein [Fulvivirga marina]
MKFFKLLIINLFVAAFIGSAIAVSMALNPVHTSACVFFAGLVISAFSQVPQGLVLRAVQVEIWESFIAENLFRDYPWLTRSKDRSEHVLNGKVVHIPQAGAKPKAAKNRNVYPVPLVQRNDDDVTYALNEFSTEATRIPNADKAELSYDKMDSVFGDHRGVLSEEVARDVLAQWYPSAENNILRSSGADTAVYLSGQTGTRKLFTPNDLAAAKTRMNKSTKKDSGPRLAIMTEDAYNQLKSDPDVNDLNKQAALGAVWKDGELVKLHGFDIVRTDVVPRFDNEVLPVIKSADAKNSATDNDAILCYDERFVHRSVGSIEFFETLQDALAQGDIYSALVRCGGRKERKDEAGCVAIVQEA